MNLKFDHITTQVRVDSRDDAIRAAAAPLLAAGKITPDYIDAVIDRENEFPTGLPAALGVAIPHADPEQVLEEGISIVTLENPVIFHGMGAPEEKIEVYLLFFLAIKDGASQVEILQQIVSIIQDEMVLHKIKDAKSTEKVYNLLNELRHEEERKFDL